jgi:hypothetical protein
MKHGYPFAQHRQTEGLDTYDVPILVTRLLASRRTPMAGASSRTSAVTKAAA